MAGRRMTLRQYARSRGLSPSSVHKALHTGRLTEYSAQYDPSRGCWLIDASKADREWIARTEPYWGGRR
jgi:hypothetical protein